MNIQRLTHSVLQFSYLCLDIITHSAPLQRHGDILTGLPACVRGLFSQAKALLFTLLLGISVSSSDRKEL